MRTMGTYAMRCATALAALCVSVVCADASAESTPAPKATPAPAASAGFMYCPLSTSVQDLDDTHTRYAVSFRSPETGRATGTVTLWAGERRFDIPFRNAVALDSRDRISPETSFVVRFAAPITLDGAVVTAIDEGGSLRPCDPWFSPWVRAARAGSDRRTRDERAAEDRFLARARAATAIDAPPAVAEPTTCSTPNRPGRTVVAISPDRPSAMLTGSVVVMILLDPADNIADARVERSSGNRSLDIVALSAARRSEFQGQIFRCRHVMAAYLFSVEFAP